MNHTGDDNAGFSARSDQQISLADSEELHRITLSNISDAVFLTDSRGDFTYVCPNVDVIFGYSRTETESMGNIARLIGPIDGILDQLAQVDAIHNHELEIWDKSGVSRFLIVNVKRITTKWGCFLFSCRDITERKRMEHECWQLNKKLEKTVAAKTKSLQEANTALKVLLKQHDEQRLELEERVTANVSQLVMPYVEQLSVTTLSDRQKHIVDVIRTNLQNLIAPFARQLTSRQFKLTPMEIKVAGLVKEGRTNKDIATILGVSKDTILSHRHNIRSKLKLKNKRINLSGSGVPQHRRLVPES